MASENLSSKSSMNPSHTDFLYIFLAGIAVAIIVIMLIYTIRKRRCKTPKLVPAAVGNTYETVGGIEDESVQENPCYEAID